MLANPIFGLLEPFEKAVKHGLALDPTLTPTGILSGAPDDLCCDQRATPSAFNRPQAEAGTFATV